MRHVVIIPARNESQYIGTTLDSLTAQQDLPDRIYVVDDGSTDDTAEIVEKAARDNTYITLLRKPPRPKRQMGGGVVETFNFAYNVCMEEEFTYLSKIDADLILPPDYFKRLLHMLDQHPDIAAGSGILFDKIGDKLMELRLPENHVPGALKTVRKHVFDEMGGFQQVLSWDIIDQVKMRSLGYRTAHLRDLEVIHLRQHASAEGLLRGKAQWGTGAYIIGSHPLFAFARGIFRMFEPPYVAGGVAFWVGYLRAAMQRIPQIPDKELIKALRCEQLHRLAHFNKLPRRDGSVAQ